MHKKTIAFAFFFLISQPLFCFENPFYVTFDASMTTKATDKYSSSLSTKNPQWALAKKLYEENAFNNLSFSEYPHIPKVIHQIWLGSPLPEKYRAIRDTWLALHPEWTYKLWTDIDIKNLKLINKKQYEKAKDYGERSDIARYEILYRFGGLYIDTDFECLKSFDIFHHCFHFYSGLGFGPEFELYNGLIGSAPGHPVLKMAIERISSHKPGTKIDTPFSTGPMFFAQCFYDALKTLKKDLRSRSVAFPSSYFYPWPCWERKSKNREDIETWFRTETYAVHHWHTSWVNRRVKKNELYLL